MWICTSPAIAAGAGFRGCSANPAAIVAEDEGAYLLMAPGPCCNDIFRGWLPTRSVAMTRAAPTSRTETVLSPSFVTYANAPFEVNPTQWGYLPTATSLTTRLDARSTIATWPVP